MSWVCSLELQERLLLYSFDARKYCMISVGVVILFKQILYPLPLLANRIQPLMCWKACQKLPYVTLKEAFATVQQEGKKERNRVVTYLLPSGIRRMHRFHKVTEGLQGAEGKVCVYPVGKIGFFLSLLSANLYLRLKLKNMDGSFTRI